MKTLRKRAPESLPRAESDLVAEGGNVLASDDAPVSIPGIAYCTNTPSAPEQVGPVGRASDQVLTWPRLFPSSQ